jgi:hypothetical protein
VDIFHLLFERCDTTVPNFGCGLLAVAARNEDMHLIEFILERYNPIEEERTKALQDAALEGNLRVMERLYQMGVLFHDTYFYLVAGKNRVGAMEMILTRQSISPREVNRGLIEAARNDCIDAIEFLVKTFPDLDLQESATASATNDYSEVLRLLLETGRVDISKLRQRVHPDPDSSVYIMLEVYSEPHF